MTQIEWGESGQKIFETGLDRGVLYLEDGSGVAWNGLTGVNEDNANGSVTSYYLDGVKYLDSSVPSDYSATLTAITYPDEFLRFDGVADENDGLLYDNQQVKNFGLSYRTLLGNDTEGTSFAYRIHLLWNLTAVPTNHSYLTMSDAVNPSDLSWAITGVPLAIPGYRPTCHVMIDSRKLDSGILPQIEAILYGTTGIADIITEPITDSFNASNDNDPSLPDFYDLKSLVLSARS